MSLIFKKISFWIFGSTQKRVHREREYSRVCGPDANFRISQAKLGLFSFNNLWLQVVKLVVHSDESENIMKVVDRRKRTIKQRVFFSTACLRKKLFRHVVIILIFLSYPTDIFIINICRIKISLVQVELNSQQIINIFFVLLISSF